MKYRNGNVISIDNDERKCGIYYFIKNRIDIGYISYLNCINLSNGNEVIIPKHKKEKITHFFNNNFESFSIFKRTYHITMSYLCESNQYSKCIDIKNANISSNILNFFNKVGIFQTIVDDNFLASVGYYNHSSFEEACRSKNIFGYKLQI